MSRGPDLARRELWGRRLREFERGTATVAEFCRREGVSHAAFYQWRRKLASMSAEPNTVRAVEQVPALSFLPVEITGGARSVIEVLLPNGARVLIPGGEHEALRIAIAAAGGSDLSLFRRELEYRNGESGTRQFIDVLLLMEQHGPERVQAAVKLCVQRRAFHAEAVVSVLRNEPTPGITRRLDLAHRPELQGLGEAIRSSSVYDQLRETAAAAVEEEVAA